jgi:hypothetical protein
MKARMTRSADGPLAVATCEVAPIARAAAAEEIRGAHRPHDRSR